MRIRINTIAIVIGLATFSGIFQACASNGTDDEPEPRVSSIEPSPGVSREVHQAIDSATKSSIKEINGVIQEQGKTIREEFRRELKNESGQLRDGFNETIRKEGARVEGAFKQHIGKEGARVEGAFKQQIGKEGARVEGAFKQEIGKEGARVQKLVEDAIAAANVEKKKIEGEIEELKKRVKKLEPSKAAPAGSPSDADFINKKERDKFLNTVVDGVQKWGLHVRHMEFKNVSDHTKTHIHFHGNVLTIEMALVTDAQRKTAEKYTESMFDVIKTVMSRGMSVRTFEYRPGQIPAADPFVLDKKHHLTIGSIKKK